MPTLTEVPNGRLWTPRMSKATMSEPSETLMKSASLLTQSSPSLKKAAMSWPSPAQASSMHLSHSSR